MQGIIADKVGDGAILVVYLDINENSWIFNDDVFYEWSILFFKKHETELCWSQANDALTPKDISSSYEVSSSERGFIARYCMKKWCMSKSFNNADAMKGHPI